MFGVGKLGNLGTVGNPFAWILPNASIDMNFAAGAYYGKTPSNLTVTRALAAYSTNTAGDLISFASNAPRITDKGLLVEEARTNLEIYSEDWTNAAYTTVRSSVSSNAAVAPSGATTADKLVEDNTASSTHLIHQSVTATSGVSQTVSVFVKAAERSSIDIQLDNGTVSWSYASFNLNTQAITGAQAAQATITAYTNGWYRLTLYGTSTSTTTRVLFYLNNGSSTSYNGDGSSGLYLWGLQLEDNTTLATSYIPTTTASVTRPFDAISLAATGQSWFNDTEGTIFGQILPIATDGSGSTTAALLQFRRDANNNIKIRVGTVISGLDYYSIDGGVAQVDTASSTFTVDGATVHKIAAAYKANDYAFSLNGAAAVKDTTATVPTSLTNLEPAGPGSALGVFYIKRMAYFNSRLADATLVSITT